MSLTLLFRDFALLGAEWVMWLLVVLSLLSIAVMVERGVFLKKHSVRVDQMRDTLDGYLESQSYDEATKWLSEDGDSMEANVVLYGLQNLSRGPAGVEDLISGALSIEKLRYDRGLGILGTIGNNAPFIGLFGTVLGIIGAFANLGEGSAEAAQQVMAAISEALVATGVGLLVAIPAVIAFNVLKAKTKQVAANTELLGRLLLSHLRQSEDPHGVSSKG